MKKSILLLLLSFSLIGSAVAQENSRSHEVGLFFKNLDGFGIRYKTGTDKMMYRFTMLSLSASHSNRDFEDTNANDENSFGAGLGLGIEFPVAVTDQFSFYYGGELTGTFSNDKQSPSNSADSKSHSIQASAGIVLGTSFQISKQVKLAAEVVPGFYWSDSKSGDRSTKSFGFGFNNNSAGLTLSYVF